MRVIRVAYVFFVCLMAVAQAEPVNIALPDGSTLKAELYRPARPDPKSAAVVMLHGCAGPSPARDDGWRNAFLLAGRFVLMPLSFVSRDLGSQCAKPDAVASPYTVRRDDAIAAIHWLVEQSFTPPGGVVVMGFSHGGSTVLATADALREPLVRGYVAFYPGCGATARQADWQSHAPLAIFIGALDDWTLAKYCSQLASKSANGAVHITIYPESYHDFDAPGTVRLREGTAGTTVHIGGNPAARQAVYAAVRRFIADLPPVGR